MILVSSGFKIYSSLWDSQDYDSLTSPPPKLFTVSKSNSFWPYSHMVEVSFVQYYQYTSQVMYSYGTIHYLVANAQLNHVGILCLSVNFGSCIIIKRDKTAHFLE